MKVTKKDIESALSNYNVGSLRSYSLPRQGLLNRIVFLKTTKGQYVLKIALVNISTLNFVLGLLDHIQMRTTPGPVRTRHKKLDIPYNGFRAYIYPFIPGKIPKRISGRMLNEVGKFLSEYHNRVSDFKTRSRREEILSISRNSIKNTISHARKASAKKDREAVCYIEKEIEKYFLPAELPEGPIHVDVKPDNSLFIGEKLKGVVDFDNAYFGPFILDLGVTMSWYGVTRGKIDMDKIKELYCAYSKGRKLNSLEMKFIFDALHFAILRNSLRALELLAQNRLPKKWVHDYLNCYLSAEKSFNMDRDSFLDFLQNKQQIIILH